MVGSEESLIIIENCEENSRFFGRKLPQNDIFKTTE